jgi:hypothetical protein
MKISCVEIDYFEGYMRILNPNAFQTSYCTRKTSPSHNQRNEDPSEYSQHVSFRSCSCHRLNPVLRPRRSQLSRARSKRQAIRPRSPNAAQLLTVRKKDYRYTSTRLHIYCQSPLALCASTCRLRVVSFFCSFAFFMLAIIPMSLSTSRFMSGASLAVKVFGGT